MNTASTTHPKLNTFWAFSELIKFQHTLFALPMAIATYVLGLRLGGMADQWFHPNLPFILLCIVSARTAAMTFNRIADRSIDPLHARTADRQKLMSTIGLTPLKIILTISIVSFIIGAFACNITCGLLSFPTLAILLGYSYFKRFSSAAHLVLGLALGLSPLGVWLALFPNLALLPIQISFFILIWVAGFDILYAMADREFDVKQGLYSIPSRFGGAKAQLISLGLHLTTILMAWYFFQQGVLPVGSAVLITVLLATAQFLFYKIQLRSLAYTFYLANIGVSFTFLVGVLLG